MMRVNGCTSLKKIRVGPEQQQVFYTVSGEDGKTHQCMMLCPKDMDQNTVNTAVVRQISADTTFKGKKTIRITQHKSAPGGMYFSRFRIFFRLLVSSLLA